MQRISLPERADWQAKAEELGFRFHTMHGEPYWDETSAYAFTLDQITDDIEAPTTDLHAMCLEAVAEIVASDTLMARLGIPEDARDIVADSWLRGDPSLYGRMDLAYDGTGPAKLLEYNADTPTALYEASAFQWLWFEDMLAAGHLAPGSDQFTSLHEALVERFQSLFAPGEVVHFTSQPGSDEDFATVEYLAWTANEAGLAPEYTPLDAIALSTAGQFLDGESRVIGTLFKLYPWEDMLRDDFADSIAGSGCRFIEPAWKALVSNKGLLPVLWRMFEGHPNLLPAVFEDELAGSDPMVERARPMLERGHVLKPLFSREGASLRIVEDGRETEVSGNRDYDTHPRIAQAYVPLPVFDGWRPVLGSWIVGDACVGLGLREDRGRITQDLSRFKPHVVLP